MSEERAVPSPLTYVYRPSLLGAPYEFRLDEHGLGWVVGRRSGRLAWRDVERVRLSFRPTGMQPSRFVTEIWAAGAPKLTVMSSSWKSMVVQERLDSRLRGLRHGTAPAAGTSAIACALRAGHQPLALLAGACRLRRRVVRAGRADRARLQAHTVSGALFVAGFLALFLWRGGDYFRRNRPRLYRADALPPELLPELLPKA